MEKGESMNKLFQSITRSSPGKSNIKTKGKIIDAQYEISICKSQVIGPDLASGRAGIDGYATNPGFTKSQWLNCQ